MTEINIQAKAKGTLRVKKIDTVTGNLIFDSGDFDNNLLNNFFTELVTLSNCFVGTDSVVSNGDTSLTSLGSVGGKVNTTSYSVNGSGDVLFKYLNTFTFSAGAIVGNMSCIGLADSTALTGTNLKIKSLIKDVNGSPTTITATASDQIVVEHTLNITWNQQQSLGTFDVDGVTYQADLYNVFMSPNAGSAGSSIYPFIGRLEATNFDGSVYPHIVSGFTVPTIPTLVSAQIPFNTGRIYNGAPITRVYTYDSSAGTMKYGLTFTMAANTNLAANAPIAAVGFGTGASSTTAYMAIAFTPALTKNNTIAYTFTLNLILSRA